MEFTYTKLIQSGQLVEIYEYERTPSPRVGHNKNKNKKAKRNKEKKIRNRFRRSAIRARETFYRTVCATLQIGKPAMATLTFVDDKMSVKGAYKNFTKFGTRLRQKFGKQIIYIAAPEFRPSGNGIHFHLLIWNLPNAAITGERTSRDIQALWRRGWLDIRPTDGGIKLAGYLAKYMSKSMFDHRLSGEKAYVSSRKCLRPVLLKNRASVAIAKDVLELVDNPLAKPVRSREYKVEWLGRCRYSAYENTITSNENYASNTLAETADDHLEEGRPQVDHS